MKSSKYNYFIPYQDSVILFNGLSKKFMILSKNTAKEIKEFLNAGKLSEISPVINNRFRNAMFLIEDDFDEIAFIKNKYKTLQQEKYYTLAILPTFYCNFSCWYCIQNHEYNSNMSEDVVKKIKTHIELYLKENEIKFFEIAWFGGEPLLQFEKIIVDISRFAINLCNKLKIQFMNSITTNGFLMNKEMVKQMKKLQFLSFQITIDGERNLHNKTRHDSALSSFDVIINNVVYLLETLTDTHLTLRYNYTPANLNIDLIVNQLNEIIPFELRERIDILPRKVWQIEDEKIDNRVILNMFKTIEENGYNIIDVDVKDSFMPCYVERKHFNTIFHSGAVDKCSNNPAEAKGYLNNDGKIIWNSENDFTLNSECMSCKFLPLCMGGCPNNKDYCNKNNSFKCQYSEKSKYNIIVNYCETILLKQNKLSYNKFDNGFVKKQ